MATQRTDTAGAGVPAQRPLCKYGAECYQKNPFHLARFRHKRQIVVTAEPIPTSVAADTTFQTTTTTTRGVDHKPNTNNVDEQKEDCSSLSIRKKMKPSAEKDTDPPMSQTNIPTTATTTKQDLLSSIIKKKYQMDMPADFYSFWQFCKSVKPDRPEETFQKCLDLVLVGPYDILSGYISDDKKNGDDDIDYCCYWRFKYDPPEFQTLAVQTGDNQFHIGYYRDDPLQLPMFVAGNSTTNGYIFTPYGGNVFSAVHNLIVQKMKVLKKDKMRINFLSDLADKLQEWASDNHISMEVKTKEMKAREKNVVAKTFHTAGIVVPVCKDVGYRPIPFTNIKLIKILDTLHSSSASTEQKEKLLDELEEAITHVQFANDECDYGMGLELGIDLFCYGSKKLHPFIKNLLPMAYQLLKRPVFEKVILAHLGNRDKVEVGRPL